MIPHAEPARYPRTILAACVLPWREDGTWDETLFRRLARDLARSLSPRLYLFGTAGEGYAVTDRQFAEITGVFVDELAANGVPMVGVISLSLPTIIERIGAAWDLGVREFQISLPSWGALNDAEVDRFFAETCGRFPEARFLHYNLARTRRLLTGADYARLAARHPNLVAVKMGGQDLAALQEVAGAVPAVRCFLTEFAYGALRDSIDCGLLCAVSACEPALAARWFEADEPERARIGPVLRAIHAAAKEAVGGQAHMDGAYDKMYVKRRFPAFPLRLIPPYAGATDEQFGRFAAACEQALRSL